MAEQWVDLSVPRGRTHPGSPGSPGRSESVRGDLLWGVGCVLGDAGDSEEQASLWIGCFQKGSDSMTRCL